MNGIIEKGNKRNKFIKQGVFLLWYIFGTLVLGAAAFFTGEIVTFAMLGIVLIALNNINMNLKKLIQIKESEQ